MRNVGRWFFGFLFVVVLAESSVAWGLEWSDAAWRDGGCPQGIEGTWVAESRSPLSGQEIEFRRDGTLLVVRSGRDLVLPVSGGMKPGEGPFVEMKIESGGSGYPPFIKIRPHLVSARDVSCQIKLFRYENAARTRQNRELSWDIYRRRVE